MRSMNNQVEGNPLDSKCPHGRKRIWVITAHNQNSYLVVHGGAQGTTCICSIYQFESLFSRRNSLVFWTFMVTLAT